MKNNGKLAGIIIAAAFAVIVFLMIIICIQANTIISSKEIPTMDKQEVGEITDIIDIYGGDYYDAHIRAIIEVENETKFIISVRNDRILKTGKILYNYPGKEGWDRYRYE